MAMWRKCVTWSSLAVCLLGAGCASAGTAVLPGGASASPTAKQPAPASRPAGKAFWFTSVQMTEASTGWALAYPTNPAVVSPSPVVLLVRTTNGARTWTDVTPRAARKALANPETTEVLYTLSGTRAYLAVNPPEPVASTVSLTDVFATDNGGRTWTESAPVKAPGYARALSFSDPDHGWLLISEGAAMGENPVQVYRTTDGGARWSLVAQSPPMDSDSTSGIPVACDKTGITFASATTGWLTSACAVGLSGELLVSRDGGVTWAVQRLPLPADVCGDSGCFLAGPEFTGGTGFVTVAPAAGTPTLLVTRDLGQAWQPVPLPAGSGRYPQIDFFGPLHGVLVSAGSQGSIGTVFYTTSDGGQTWTAVRQGIRFIQPGAAIDFVSASAGFAWSLGAGTQGATPPPMYETTDSGHTWTPFAPRLVS